MPHFIARERFEKYEPSQAEIDNEKIWYPKLSKEKIKEILVNKNYYRNHLDIDKSIARSIECINSDEGKNFFILTRAYKKD